MTSYSEFIDSKHMAATLQGFEVDRRDVNPVAFEYQKDVIVAACRSGRYAGFLDCGLGKTLIELEWSRLVWEHSGHDSMILLLTPLSVAKQMVREAEKFGINCPVRRVMDQSECGPGINVTNYERLHLFDSSRFAGVVLDESSILKSFMGATKTVLCDEFSATPFRLCGTATPAPNDRKELGNHSQFLGIMDSSEMLMRWFINDTMKAGGYRLKKHSSGDFWKWVASWSACLRRPSDLGYSDEGFILPPMEVIDHEIESTRKVAGHLIDPGGKVSATNVHDVKRSMLPEKAEVVASLANGTTDAYVVWVDTDYEADAIRPLIPDAVEVRGSMSVEMKERRLDDFVNGQTRVLITKPEIGGFGSNWQHCHRMSWFPSFSYEAYYQCFRRFYRFGQKHKVTVDCVKTDLEKSVSDTAAMKQFEHQEMQEEIAKWMQDAVKSGAVRKGLSMYQPESAMSMPPFLRA